MKESTRHYLFLFAFLVFVCALPWLAMGCAGTKPEPDQVAAEPTHQTRRAPNAGVELPSRTPGGQEADPRRTGGGPQADINVPELPTLPATPTRREYKAYKRQLAAWQKVQQAYARSLRGPRKVKATGTGALAVAAAPGAQVQASPVTTDNTKAGQRGGAAATAPNATASTTTRRGLPWWPFALAAVAGVVWWQRKRLLPTVFA